MNDEPTLEFRESFDCIQRAHGLRMAAKGFWVNRGDKVLDKMALIALMHSELSECLEGVRKDLMDDHLPDRKMEAAELADVVLRVMDYCAFYGIPLADIIIEKMVYNESRPHMHGDKKI